MFDLNRRYNRPIVAPFVTPIQIKRIFQSPIPMEDLSKYDRRGHASPSG